MQTTGQIRITRIIAAAGQIAYELSSLHFANFRPVATSWQPAMNAYARAGSIDLCFDLAGVSREEIEVVIEVGRVTVRGSRAVPKPELKGQAEAAGQVLLMEIESGPFLKVIDLPQKITPEETTARQDSGFLWLHLTS